VQAVTVDHGQGTPHGDHSAPSDHGAIELVARRRSDLLESVSRASEERDGASRNSMSRGAPPEDASGTARGSTPRLISDRHEQAERAVEPAALLARLAALGETMPR